jgi:hypothetical protein
MATPTQNQAQAGPPINVLHDQTSNHKGAPAPSSRRIRGSNGRHRGLACDIGGTLGLCG